MAGLPHTKLSEFLEERVRQLLPPMLPAGAGPIHVRVLSIRDKTVQVRDGMKNYYAESDNPMPAELPYKAKAVFVFQGVEGVDVCFFGCVCVAAVFVPYVCVCVCVCLLSVYPRVSTSLFSKR